MQHITTITLELASSQVDATASSQVFSMGPFMQGVLMEHIDASYAGCLHQLAFNPYSQYCTPNGKGGLIWRISALTDEAAEQIIEPLSRESVFNIKAVGESFTVEKTTIEKVDIKSFIGLINQAGSSKIRVRFVTPTAFKSQGVYVIMPTSRLIFQNLFMHYNQVYEGDKEVDEETVDYLGQHARIVSYNLRSQYFAHAMKNGGKVPAFVGAMTVSLSGPQPATGLARMLLKFGEYAGVGIKTSMGMGAMRCLQSEERPRKEEQN